MKSWPILLATAGAWEHGENSSSLDLNACLRMMSTTAIPGVHTDQTSLIGYFERLAEELDNPANGIREPGESRVHIGSTLKIGIDGREYIDTRRIFIDRNTAGKLCGYIRAATEVELLQEKYGWRSFVREVSTEYRAILAETAAALEEWAGPYVEGLDKGLAQYNAKAEARGRHRLTTEDPGSQPHDPRNDVEFIPPHIPKHRVQKPPLLQSTGTHAGATGRHRVRHRRDQSRSNDRG